jgi:hypothetical protein
VISTTGVTQLLLGAIFTLTGMAAAQQPLIEQFMHHSWCLQIQQACRYMTKHEHVLVHRLAHRPGWQVIKSFSQSPAQAGDPNSCTETTDTNTSNHLRIATPHMGSGHIHLLIP